MRRKHLPLLTWIGICIVAGGVFLLKKVTVLCLENMERRKVVSVRLNPPQSFSLFYIHSIYRERAIEEFHVENGAIVLKGVRTKSPAVMEYYGFEDLKEFHPMNQRLGAFVIVRRGMGEGQGLTMGEKKISLSEMGEEGDRIRLTAGSMPLGRYLLLVVLGGNPPF